jgi:hypothetical protein
MARQSVSTGREEKKKGEDKKIKMQYNVCRTSVHNGRAGLGEQKSEHLDAPRLWNEDDCDAQQTHARPSE